MRRRLDWAERLFDEIESAGAREYSELYYCATFAADCVRAMTDTDPLEHWRGLPRAEAEAAVLEQYGSVPECLKAKFGAPLPISLAQRGDVVVQADGITLGVCIGSNAVFISDSGVAMVRTLDCSVAFRV